MPGPFDAVLDELRVAIGDAYRRNEDAHAWQRILDAVRGAADPSQLATLLALDLSTCTGGAVDHSVVDGAESWPELPRALLALAGSWSGADRAAAIGLAVARSAVRPAPYLAANPEDGLRPVWLGEIERQVDLFRQEMDSPHAVVRSAAAQALAHCRNVTDPDLAALATRLARESDPDAQAALLLALGATQRRLGRSDPSPFATGMARPDPFVRACAAAAWAATGATLDEEHAAALALALDRDDSAPREWGWGAPGWAETRAHVALMVLAWANVPASPVLIERLGRPSLGYGAVRALVHLGGFDRERPPLGVVLDDLDEPRRRILSALAAHRDIQTVQGLGFSQEDDIEPFLRAEDPMWRPLRVAAPGGPRSWHLWRIWRGCVHGELPVEAAAAALVDGLDPAALLPAICHGRRTIFTQVTSRPPDASHPRTELELYREIVRLLGRRGIDPRPTFDALCADPPEWFPDSLATCLVAWNEVSGATLDERQERVVARGLHYARDRELLVEALASRSPERAARIAALADEDPGDAGSA